jgi:hypothetical protein
VSGEKWYDARPMKQRKSPFSAWRSYAIGSLLVGCFGWTATSSGSHSPKCPNKLELRAKFDEAWNSLARKPTSLNQALAFELAMRNARWSIRDHFPLGGTVDSLLEQEFEKVKYPLLTPALEYLLGTKPKATPSMRQSFKGHASNEVVLVVHARRNEEIATAELLEKNRFKNVPVLALISPYYALSNPRLLAQLSTLRHSYAGEIRDARINANEVHLIGGAFGDCLTTATADALEQMLDYPDRQQAIAHLHLQASWGWHVYARQWKFVPEDSRAGMLYDYFNDKTGGNGYRNEALDPFEFVESKHVDSEPPYWELKLRRTRDSKIGLIRLYGFVSP